MPLVPDVFVHSLHHLRDALAYRQVSTEAIQKAVDGMPCTKEEAALYTALTAVFSREIGDVLERAADDIEGVSQRKWLFGIAMAEWDLSRRLNEYLGLENAPSAEEERLINEDRFVTYPCPWERSPSSE